MYRGFICHGGGHSLHRYPARVAELEAVTDIEMGIPQQDVYVEQDDDMLYRIHQDDLTNEILAQPAYATIETNPPDLSETGDNPRGPYPEGEPLGFTFGEWLEAEGHAEYVKYASGIDSVHFSFEICAPTVSTHSGACSCGHRQIEMPLNRYADRPMARKRSSRPTATAISTPICS